MSAVYREIDRCRICGNQDLLPILHLGTQALTGIFPRTKEQKVAAGPLELLKCREDPKGGTCGLVQLRQSYDKNRMYGGDYGYRSGLNQSMVAHLRGKVRGILEKTTLAPGDLVVDIGSNDGTLLKAYPDRGAVLAGIDPTAGKFRKYYPPRIRPIPDFFSAALLRREFGAKKAKVVTSIAMFYDLESPMDFMREIAGVLADDGLWVVEQSYLAAMLKATAYDTVCHEHLEYYALKQVKWMADRTGLKIVGVELNGANGGSFSATLAKAVGPFKEDSALLSRLLARERRLGLHALKPYKEFEERVLRHRDRLRAFLRKVRGRGESLLGYGASTKGNVILQFCGLTPEDIPAIAEVNEDKFGCFTPGTGIAIISEAEARSRKPDYMMVLPWHFREGIVAREKGYLAGGGRLVFPLPSLKVVSK